MPGNWRLSCLRTVWRRGSPLSGVTKAEDLGSRIVRLHYTSAPSLTAGRTLQFRETYRDCCGGFIVRSTNVAWRNVCYQFLHGMGLVSQFSQDLTMDHLSVAPDPSATRTCAAWADMLHFSGCRGKITVQNSTLQGSNDDPINVHGTHLRVISQPATNQRATFCMANSSSLCF